MTAMGLRMGTDFGITLQQRILPKTTLQGMVSSSAATSQTTATILIQSHQPLISKRFNFYVGGGVHNRWIESLEEGTSSERGITAIAGAEMTLGRLNLSWDYKPVYHLNVERQAFESETAISLRYVFIKQQKRKSKKGRGIFKSNKSKKDRDRRRKAKQREKKKRVRLKAKEGRTRGR